MDEGEEREEEEEEGVDCNIVFDYYFTKRLKCLELWMVHIVKAAGIANYESKFA